MDAQRNQFKYNHFVIDRPLTVTFKAGHPETALQSFQKYTFLKKLSIVKLWIITDDGRTVIFI
mgnify:CR=1 FL=1